MSLIGPLEEAPRLLASRPAIHHFGFAVRRIVDAVSVYSVLFTAEWDGAIFHDPLQAVRIAFLKPDAAGPLIELVEAAGHGAPVPVAGPAQGAMHHVCLEVDNLEAAIIEIRRLGAVLVRRPAPAVAFGNRHIAWLYTRQHFLLELLERSQ